ncbi:hypothetical protein ACSVDA_06475 [Cytobacillus sp. Hm23]
MIIASDTFKITAKQVIADVYIKLELLDRDEQVIDVMTSKAIDGSIDIDKTRGVRRSFALTLENDYNEFNWSAGGRIWLNKRIRLYVSYDSVEWISLGVFIIDGPAASSSHDGNVIAEISGGDKWRLLDGSPIGNFTYNTTIETGSSVYDAIELIAVEGGINNLLFDPCDATIPYTLNYDTGTARGDAMKELADFANYDIYFDNNGYLRFRQKVDYENAPIVETYDKSQYTTYAGSVKRLDTKELCNKVIVVAGNNREITPRTVQFQSEISARDY